MMFTLSLGTLLTFGLDSTSQLLLYASQLMRDFIARDVS
jgi:hypothetical protein